MKTGRIILLVAICTTLSGLTYASTMQEDIGCGLGTMIWQGGKFGTTRAIFASYTNATFSNTSGMTSGTSGCKKFEGLVEKDREPVYYAEANYSNLQTQMARGNGEVLEGFAQTWGCTSQAIPVFDATMRSNYESIFPSSKTGFMDMVRAVKAQIKANPALAHSCNNVG